MSKAHNENQAIGMIFVGILLAYGSSALKGNVFYSAFLLGGIALVACGVFLLAKTFGLIQIGKTKAPQQTVAGANVKSNDALDALKLRFAKGEITEDQYNQMKKELSE